MTDGGSGDRTDDRADDRAGADRGVLAPFTALLFDLDGVITRTAAVHAQAWKALFDDVLRRRAEEHGEPFVPFALPDDYLRYVDGKPRYDGVASFLASRGIDVPWGSPSDPPDRRTICGYGNRKDETFRATVERSGVEVFPDAVVLLDAARDAGKALAVVSASVNADLILDKVGLLDRFAVRITGAEATSMGLAGKPAPDTFLAAAELLGVASGDAVVFEDAIAGVQAGHAGKFGLVVGVDRGGAGSELARNGADIVVTDLASLAP